MARTGCSSLKVSRATKVVAQARGAKGGFGSKASLGLKKARNANRRQTVQIALRALSVSFIAAGAYETKNLQRFTMPWVVIASARGSTVPLLRGQQQLIASILPLQNRNGGLDIILLVNDEAIGGLASLDHRQAAAFIQLFGCGALVEDVLFP
jgi:hypothetical protein